LAVSRDRTTLAWGTWDGQVHVWDGATVRSRRTIPAHPDQDIYAIAISPDGQAVASAGNDVRIVLWDATTGAERQVIAKDLLARSLAFSVDGRRLAGYCFDKTVRLWDLAQGQQISVASEYTDIYGWVAFSPDGKTYVSIACGGPYVLRIHDAASGEERRRVELSIPNGSWVRALDYSPDGSLLAVATNGGKVFLFETRSWKTVKQFQLGPVRGEINGVSFSPDGRYLATANGNGTVYVLRVDVSGAITGGATAKSPPRNPRGPVSPPPPAAKPAAHSIDDAFIRAVAALPAEEQVARVVAKLKELNPDYDGKEEHGIENGQVTFLALHDATITEPSPVRALSKLKNLQFWGPPQPKGGFRSSGLSNLAPLQGLPLEYLGCAVSEVSDLAPLRGMPLKHLNCSVSLVADITPLKGMPLEKLNIDGTQVSDLSPLRGAPLTSLWCYDTKVVDLSPVKDLPLKEIRCSFDPKRDTEILRSIKTLETINGLPAAEFWKQVEAGTVPPGDGGREHQE
jgi:hypothetical protein